MTDQRSVPLSVLDLSNIGSGRTSAQALADTTALARRADELGFHRFWVAEHHSMPAVASTAPAVLLAHLGAQTTQIRLGSGGVMLPNHPALVVAEQFAMLEALYPGRIDLGVGRAPGADPMTAAALRRTGEEDFPAALVDVLTLLGQPAAGLSASAAATRLSATPAASGTPQVWLLGSSLYSAQLAARLGLAFSYAHHFNTGLTEQAAAAYRNGFQPSAVLDRPHFMVSASVIIADTEEQAVWLSGPNRVMMLQMRTRGPLGPLVTPQEAERVLDALQSDPNGRAVLAQIPGTQLTTTTSQAVTALHELVDRVAADELILTASTYDIADRIHTLEEIAALW